MNTTIGELELYDSKINKFNKFVAVKSLDKEEQDKIMKDIEFHLEQAEEHLNHPSIVMPEGFRKEWQERKTRCQNWINLGPDHLYLEHSTIRVPIKNKDDFQQIGVVHIISFEEA